MGSFLRHGLHPIVFLVNNDGYVIERVIHGWNEAYNDIASWNWCALAKAMSATENQADTATVKEVGTIAKMMKETQKERSALMFREVMLGRHELPIVSLAWKPN
ncbi:putative pyruvate/indole-pyruvate carboxylase [Lotmaria passim]